jgi:hypothetical protein
MEFNFKSAVKLVKEEAFVDLLQSYLAAPCIHVGLYFSSATNTRTAMTIKLVF